MAEKKALFLIRGQLILSPPQSQIPVRLDCSDCTCIPSLGKSPYTISSWNLSITFFILLSLGYISVLHSKKKKKRLKCVLKYSKIKDK